MNKESKQKIRQESKARVRAIGAEEKVSRSALIFSRIAALPALQRAKVVALYASLPDEPQTAEFIEQLSHSHRIVLPRVAGEDMDFYPYEADNIKCGAMRRKTERELI